MLEGIKIAIIATDGVEELELRAPMEMMSRSSIHAELLTPQGRNIRTWSSKVWAGKVSSDGSLEDADASAYHALIIPGGVINCDALRMNEHAIRFVHHMMGADRCVAAICHGPQLLIEANAAERRRLTSYPAIKTDLINAGAEWIDAEVVIDRTLITSRFPSDLSSFNRALLQILSEQRSRAVGGMMAQL